MKIRHILFPIDFSNASEATADYVAGLAQITGAKVWLLHVIARAGVSAPRRASEVRLAIPSTEPVEQSEGYTTAVGLARGLLCRFQGRYFSSNVPSEVCIRSGRIAETILHFASETQADLVMMPMLGRRPTCHFPICSTLVKLLHTTTVPVWTSAHKQTLRPFRPYRHVLCAVGYRPPLRDLLTRAREISGLFRSTLSVVSVIPHLPNHRVCSAEKVAIQDLKSKTESTLELLFAELKVMASLHVVEGTVGTVIRQAAAVEHADLTVIGRGHSREPMADLFTHSYELMWESPVLLSAFSAAAIQPAQYLLQRDAFFQLAGS
jgi:nucleotide-binding universal stress UspA family protein